jgi:ubiquinone/menaquinone biosynthesis C-methylase UbiE
MLARRGSSRTFMQLRDQSAAGMMSDIRGIAASFDERAQTYASNDWHRRCAERLVVLCQLRPGYWVLDAGTGTGFAALAAARAVGSAGHVYGVDISAGMLREACAAVKAAGLTNVDLVEGDVVDLPYGDGTFDAITCAAGLLYMPVSQALGEWYRVLKFGGLVGFSTMRAGSPPGGRIFRECAATFGILLRDPSEPLGSVAACEHALDAAGFHVVNIVGETVAFSAQDLKLAWDSNVKSSAHADVLRLGTEEQLGLKTTYLDALAREEREHPGALDRAEILYALGRR